MSAARLHDLVEQGNVERDHRDGRTGLRDERLVDRDPCLAAQRGELRVEFALHAFEVLLGEADGAVLVDRPCDFRPDVGISQGDGTRRDGIGGEEGVDPHLPVFAAHDRDRLGDIIAFRGFDGDVADDTRARVEVLGREGLTDRFEDRLERLACLRVRAARRGEAVDDGVDLTEVRLDGGDHVGLHGVREGVAIE